MKNYNNIISKLKNLDNSELIYVMSEVLPDRDPYKEEPLFDNARLFLGISFTDKAGDDGIKHSIKAIAYPDQAEYDDISSGPDWGLCQEAHDEKFNIDLVSNFKNGISPFDGSKIFMT